MSTKSSEIGNEAVTRATGKGWAEWVAILDGIGAERLAHKETARILRETHRLSPWWSQMVTVHYERLRGLRQVHQKPDGFEVNVSRTVDLPLDAAFIAWSDPALRRRWAPSVALSAARMRPNHSIRADGPGGGKLTVRFTARTSGRTQVAIEHARLASASQVEQRRKLWRSVLENMAALPG